MKNFLILLINLFFFSCQPEYRTEFSNLQFSSASQSNIENHSDIDAGKIKEAKAFAKNNSLDTNIAFMVDMKIHSGKKRFFVVDLNTKKVLHSGLCCHGMGKGSTCENPVFSNEKGSYCTSLGKYKTGARAYSNWGINIHYKLHGLEKK